MENSETGAFKVQPDLEAQFRVGMDPETFDLDQTEKLGLLTHPDKKALDFLDSTLKEVLQTGLNLERGAFDQVPISEGYTPEKDQLYRLQELVTFLTHIAYLPPEGDPGRDYVLGKFSRNDQKLTLEKVVQTYTANGVAPGNLHPHYNFKDPALVQLRIHDPVKSQTLILEYFPQQFTDYGAGNKGLRGADLAEVAEILGAGRIPAHKRTTILKDAEATQKKPSFRISLEGSGRDPIAAISGDYVELGGRRGFNMGIEQVGQPSTVRNSFEGVHAFLPLRGQPKQGELPMQRLVTDVMGMELKPKFKAKAPPARIGRVA